MPTGYRMKKPAARAMVGTSNRAVAAGFPSIPLHAYWLPSEKPATRAMVCASKSCCGCRFSIGKPHLWLVVVGGGWLVGWWLAGGGWLAGRAGA